MVNTNHLLNPYDGDIFPREAAGAKLFQIVMQPELNDSKRFSVTASDSMPLQNTLSSACSQFGWGHMNTAVPISYDPVTNAPSEYGNLLVNPDISMQAALVWTLIMQWRQLFLVKFIPLAPPLPTQTTQSFKLASNPR